MSCKNCGSSIYYCTNLRSEDNTMISSDWYEYYDEFCPFCMSTWHRANNCSDYAGDVWEGDKKYEINEGCNPEQNIVDGQKRKSISLNNFKLLSIPKTALKAVEIKELDLSNNYLAEIDNELFTNNLNMERLSINNNKFRRIPKDIAKLKNLKVLNISNNEIISIPRAIINLPNLQKIVVDNNPLEEPPIEIANQGIEAIKKWFESNTSGGCHYALVIGIARYNNFPDLPKVATDAEAIARLLLEYGDYQIQFLPAKWNESENRFEMAIDRNLSSRELKEVLTTFLLEQAKGQDGLVYFAGHSFEVPSTIGDREGYLASSDSTNDGRNAIRLDELNQLIRESDLKSLIVILDCGLKRDWLNYSLTAFHEKQDYWIIAACRSFERAREDAGQGVFTSALLKGLSPENADQEGQISVHRLFDFVSWELRGKGQEPIYMGGGRSIALVSYQSLRQRLSETEKFNVPLQEYTQFIGRQAELKKLLEYLSPNYRPFITIIQGMGGIGKTALAIEAAHLCWQAKHSQSPSEEIPIFDAIIFASAKREFLTPSGIVRRPVRDLTLQGIFRTIALTLDDPTITQAADEKQQIDQVYQSLRRQRTLLIIDDFEDLETRQEKDKVLAFLDNVPFPTKVIITTRNELVSSSGQLIVNELPKADSLKLIEQQAQEKEITLTHAQAKRIYYRFGGIPVALINAVGQIAMGYSLKQILESAAITSVAFSPDGQCVVTGDRDGIVRLWDLRGNPIGEPFVGHESFVTSVAFSPDARLIASGSDDNTFKLWDITGRLLMTCEGHTSSVTSVAFSPDARLIASGSDDSTFKLWDITNGYCLMTCEGHTGGVTSVAFSPDGQLIVSGSDDKTIRLWDITNGYSLMTWKGHTNDVNFVAFSPDMRLIASGSDDRTFRLWDLKMRECLRAYTEHTGGVTSIDFSPDGKLIASGSRDRTICLWRLADGNLLRVFRGHTGGVTSVAFSPDCQTIVSGSLDKTIRFWNLLASEEGSPPTPQELPIIYSLQLETSSPTLSVGEELEVAIHLGFRNAERNNTYLFEIPREETIGNELNIILKEVPAGFQLDSSPAISLPLDTESVSEATERQPIQTGSFRLTALRPGASKIAVELYRGDTYETTLETEVQVTGLEDIALLESRLTVQPRPVPQPDLTLQVSTSWNETASAYTFHYQLKSFRASTMFAGGIQYCSQAIPARWLAQVREIWQAALETASEASPEDTWSRLTSLGQHLFQRLFPTELQQDLRNLSYYPISNLLVLADREAQFPWGLLHTGQEFLGERLIIGQWPWELNDARPYEFPVGAINFAHYANVEQPEIWATLLKPPHAPEPNLTFGLQVTPASPIRLVKPTPTGNYLGWFNLTAPPEMAGEQALVQVHLVDGTQLIHSLTFSLKVSDGGGERS